MRIIRLLKMSKTSKFEPRCSRLRVGLLRAVERLLEVVRLWRAVAVPRHPAAGDAGRAAVPRVEGGVAALQHRAMQQLEDGDDAETANDDAEVVKAAADAEYDQHLGQVKKDVLSS